MNTEPKLQPKEQNKKETENPLFCYCRGLYETLLEAGFKAYIITLKPAGSLPSPETNYPLEYCVDLVVTNQEGWVVASLLCITPGGIYLYPGLDRTVVGDYLHLGDNGRIHTDDTINSTTSASSKRMLEEGIFFYIDQDASVPFPLHQVEITSAALDEYGIEKPIYWEEKADKIRPWLKLRADAIDDAHVAWARQNEDKKRALINRKKRLSYGQITPSSYYFFCGSSVNNRSVAPVYLFDQEPDLDIMQRYNKYKDRLRNTLSDAVMCKRPLPNGEAELVLMDIDNSNLCLTERTTPLKLFLGEK